MTSNYIDLVRRKKKWGYDKARSKFPTLNIGPMLLNPPPAWLARQNCNTFARTDLVDPDEVPYDANDIDHGEMLTMDIDWEAQD